MKSRIEMVIDLVSEIQDDIDRTGLVLADAITDSLDPKSSANKKVAANLIRAAASARIDTARSIKIKLVTILQNSPDSDAAAAEELDAALADINR